ncbi:MAG: hypothetical protein DCC71_02875 [Proteobacteria bacterium]|nr:MAG: hypothetical protein DCC71_02875 [Pseudomonadota bacterium]
MPPIAQPVPAAPARILRALENGALLRGRDVDAVQRALAREGFDPGRPDGVFGPRTAGAVARFQRARGLVVDGEVGPETAGALGVVLEAAA